MYSRAMFECMTLIDRTDSHWPRCYVEGLNGGCQTTGDSITRIATIDISRMESKAEDDTSAAYVCGSHDHVMSESSAPSMR